MMAARFQRQACFLCDLPHSPWAILHDFSEPICRGCCNYEGGDRIEEIIHYTRILRKNWENSEGRNSRGIKNERLNSTGSSVSSTPSPPPSSRAQSAVNNGGPNFPVAADPRQPFVKYPNHQHGGEDGMDNNHPNAILVHQKLSSPDPKGGPTRVLQNMGPREERRGSGYGEELRHGLINGNPVMPRPHPGPLVGPLAPPHVALEPPRQEHLQAHATLTVLNRCVPFDIRFKKEHNLIGRIFAFDVNNKPGMEFELKVFIEYPRGSGCVFQSASGVAKKMHTECHKEMSRGHSSGYKYLEYEKERSTGEWRPLGDFLQESVRYFKEPAIPELLPRPQLDAEFPLPNVNLSFNPRPGTLYGRKRKGTMDLEEYEIATGKRGIPMGHPTREEMMHAHPAWIQNQVEGGKLIVNTSGIPIPPGTPVSSIPSASISPMVTTPVSKIASMPIPTNEAHIRAQSKSPINNSAMRSAHYEGLPGAAIREEVRTGPLVTTAAGHVSPHRRSPRPPSGPISKSAETQSGPVSDSDGKEKSSSGQNILRCSLCRDKLEDTHFVQCPSVMHHKFCFPCSRDSIKKQGAGTEVFCPSGERCPLQGSNLPWAFMQGEIATILGTEFTVKKEKESQ